MSKSFKKQKISNATDFHFMQIVNRISLFLMNLFGEFIDKIIFPDHVLHAHVRLHMLDTCIGKHVSFEIFVFSFLASLTQIMLKN